VIGEHGGAVIKKIGDSVMAEFTSVAAGVRAAVVIQRQLHALNDTLADRERIRLRIGIHTGTAFRRESDVFGDAVNLAARITKRTGPAQILVSKAVQEAITGDGDFNCVWLGKVEFEGRAEKEGVFEVLWTDPATYQELRRNVTAALLRGDLVSPGLELEELLSAAAAEGAIASPLTGMPATPGDAAGQPPVTPLPERYEVLGELGRGGMGIVYKARDRETGEIVAIKLLMPQIACDDGVMERFKNEPRLARKITHKYVCRTHDLSRTGDTAFITMEYVEGESLRGALNRFGTLSSRKVIQIGQQICAALHEAHTQGVVHRDLKPENVMLDEHGNVKLMDFGIARSVNISSKSTGNIVGTPAYMAPEQAEGKPVDSRADIYALGLILYEAMTGIPAFMGESPVAVAVMQIREDPTPPRLLEPSLSPHLEAVILRCLAKDPAHRFSSAKELGEAICAPTSQGVLEKHLPEVRWLAAAATLAFLLGGTFWLGRATKTIPSPRKEASVSPSASQPSQAAAAGYSVASSAPSPGNAATAPPDPEGAGPAIGGSGGPLPIARNPTELEQLERKNSHALYYRLDLRESTKFVKVGPLLVRVNKANGKKQVFTLAFSTKEHVVEMKDRTLYEPIRFYDERTRRTLEVVVYRIENGHVSGYLTDPGAGPSGPPIPKTGPKSGSTGKPQQ
jgi:serine/threonine protein kinase